MEFSLVCLPIQLKSSSSSPSKYNFLLSLTMIFPPQVIVLAIPTPPETIREPVVVDDESVVE